MRKRKWTIDSLRIATKESHSIRSVLKKIGLRETGGNYSQIKKHFKVYSIDISHFVGKNWNKGIKVGFLPRVQLKDIMVKNSTFQSYKLRNRLFREGIKEQKCELCNWAQKSKDGRIPVELDHINGDRMDNRIENLRILCPNCHSLQSTHRGRNINKMAGW